MLIPESKRKYHSLAEKMKKFCLLAGMEMVLFLLAIFLMGAWFRRENSRAFQNYLSFSEYWDDLRDIDSELYQYVQIPDEESRQACLKLLSRMEGTADFYFSQERARTRDLGMLAEKYILEAAKELDQAGSLKDRADAYALLAEYKEIMEGLYDSFQEEAQAMLREQQESLSRRWHQYLLILLSAGAAAILLLVVKLLSQSQRIIKPVTELTQQAEKITSGQRLVEMKYHTQILDELDTLNNAFYQMVETTNRNYDSLQKQKDLEVRLSQTRLLLLQSRVNPHFLFNTLNTTAGLALEENADRTADMLLLTAKYLRYALAQLDKTVTLEEEISHAMDYLSIQKVRFDDRFQVALTMEEDCAAAAVPSMILQPLCENALIYGMEPSVRVVHIVMEARKEGEDAISVSVIDDGAGMSSGRLQEILGHVENAENYDDSDGLGIVNTFCRIKAFYRKEAPGKDAACFIESKLNEGTRITFLMPYINQKK